MFLSIALKRPIGTPFSKEIRALFTILVLLEAYLTEKYLPLKLEDFGAKKDTSQFQNSLLHFYSSVGKKMLKKKLLVVTLQDST